MWKPSLSCERKIDIGERASKLIDEGEEINDFSAKEGIKSSTCKDCIKYYRGILALEEVYPGVKNKIIEGKIKISSATMETLSGLNRDEIMKRVSLSEYNHKHRSTLKEKYDLGKAIINCQKNGERTDEVFGKLGISNGSAYWAKRIFIGVEKADRICPGSKDKLLSGKIKITQREAQMLCDLSAEEIKKELAEKSPARIVSEEEKNSLIDLTDATISQMSSSLENYFVNTPRLINVVKNMNEQDREALLGKLNSGHKEIEKYKNIIKNTRCMED